MSFYCGYSAAKCKHRKVLYLFYKQFYLLAVCIFLQSTLERKSILIMCKPSQNLTLNMHCTALNYGVWAYLSYCFNGIRQTVTSDTLYLYAQLYQVLQVFGNLIKPFAIGQTT